MHQLTLIILLIIICSARTAQPEKGGAGMDRDSTILILLWIGITALFFCVFFFGRRSEKKAAARREANDPLVKTKILYGSGEQTSKPRVLNTVGRAVVGNWAAGPVGAAVGAATAERKTQEKKTATFRLYFRSGREEIRTVEEGTADWHRYMEKLEQ